MKISRQTYLNEAQEIPMTPLIDIVFLTLVFLPATSIYARIESEVDIALPTADSAVQSERQQGEIYINLREDGSIVVNDRAMDLPELQEVLNRVAEYFPGGAVIVRGDQKAMLGRAIQVLDCCRKADIQNVAFSAIPSEKKEPAP